MAREKDTRLPEHETTTKQEALDMQRGWPLPARQDAFDLLELLIEGISVDGRRYIVPCIPVSQLLKNTRRRHYKRDKK